MSIRIKQKAFHPNAFRSTICIGSKIYCFKRVSIDKKQTIISITNLTSKTQYPRLNMRYKKWKNLINPILKFEKKDSFRLKPFETMWLSNI